MRILRWFPAASALVLTVQFAVVTADATSQNVPPSSEEKTGNMTKAQVAGQSRSPVAQAKERALAAFVQLKAGKISLKEFHQVDDQVYRMLHVQNKAGNRILAVPSAGDLQAAVTSDPVQLAVTQVGQERNNWCGPASAFMVMQSLGQTTSAYDGQELSQSVLSTATYTNAGLYGGTDWVDLDMPRALNRWRFGTGKGFVQVTPSSATDLWNKVSYDIAHSIPVAQDMTEVYNGPHYNGHPNRLKSIKHWTVSIGVWASVYGPQLYIADPATTVFSTAQPYFWYSYVHAYRRMTWPYRRGIVW